jgi:uncharacterized protein YjiS (DUF1127 family)
MTVQSFTAESSRGFGIGEAVKSIMDGLSARIAARRRYRRVRAELLDYSPQQLAELGISQADVDFVAEDASRC